MLAIIGIMIIGFIIIGFYMIFNNIRIDDLSSRIESLENEPDRDICE